MSFFPGRLSRSHRRRLGGAIAPFSDDFDRANGALGTPWTGATWTIDTNQVNNTPVSGAEMLSDPGLEANYTAGLCDSLATQGTAPTVAQSADVHGGAKAQQMAATGVSSGINTSQTHCVLTLGNWYDISAWFKRIVTVGSGLYPLYLSSTKFQPFSYGALLASATYAQVQRASRCKHATYTIMWAYSNANPSDTGLIDDISIKPLTLSELFCSHNFGGADVQLEIDVTLGSTLTSKTAPAGLVACLDDPTNPANFLIAYVNERQANSQRRAVLEKCVAGTYTTLFNASIPAAAHRLLRLEKTDTSVKLYVDDVQVGTTQTVTDADLVKNTYHGMFSTHLGNTLDDYSCVQL